MFTPWNIHCEMNTLRGQLKHSWLENQLCNKTADDVVFLWQQGGWLALEKEFDARIQDALRLADNLEDGFSPAQLIDSLTPFSSVDKTTKNILKQAVHASYLESSGISNLQAPLRKAATALGGAIQKLRELWLDRDTDQGEANLRRAWEDVSLRAHTLLKIMEQLPKGVVLP